MSLRDMSSSEIARLMSENPVEYKRLAAEVDAQYAAPDVPVLDTYVNGFKQTPEAAKGQKFRNGILID